ncbi:RICIN domain-containing protein [Actinomadura macra]|uniref:RICIN domain-containing protein n=1 Tax=Actinomadura macra TaxID=46164 RepID=UPI000835A94F|nr:RICIN domain-containing protein [Actinomadura macra]
MTGNSRGNRCLLAGSAALLTTALVGATPSEAWPSTTSRPAHDVAPTRQLDGDVGPRSAYNGRCLDADLNQIGHNGTKVQLWDCIPGAANQRWILTTFGDGTSTIKSVRSGRCLDADLNHIGHNGTRVQLWDCYSTYSHQRWILRDYNPDGTFRIINVRSRRCLDADLNHIGGNGTPIQLWNCLPGAANQRWR